MDAELARPQRLHDHREVRGGKISGNSAVNNYGGPYTAGPGDAFSVGDLASTMMAGPEPDMRSEGAYLKLLSEAEES